MRHRPGGSARSGWRADPAEVLESFRAHDSTTKLLTTTDPNPVFDLRAKLDATVRYDETRSIAW